MFHPDLMAEVAKTRRQRYEQEARAARMLRQIRLAQPQGHRRLSQFWQATRRWLQGGGQVNPNISVVQKKGLRACCADR